MSKHHGMVRRGAQSRQQTQIAARLDLRGAHGGDKILTTKMLRATERHQGAAARQRSYRHLIDLHVPALCTRDFVAAAGQRRWIDYDQVELLRAPGQVASGIFAYQLDPLAQQAVDFEVAPRPL